MKPRAKPSTVTNQPAPRTGSKRFVGRQPKQTEAETLPARKSRHYRGPGATTTP